MVLLPDEKDKRAAREESNVDRRERERMARIAARCATSIRA